MILFYFSTEHFGWKRKGARRGKVYSRFGRQNKKVSQIRKYDELRGKYENMGNLGD